MQEKILILDFGSQTTQLIGRRLRELNTYCEIVPYNKLPQDLTGIAGIILSGSPYSVYDAAAFRTELAAIRGQRPLLGICYGAQSLVHQAGGQVEPCDSREYGRAHLTLHHANDPLLKDLTPGSTVWMSHGDTITTLPKGFRIIASTEDVPAAAFRIDGEHTWGVQFHPEAFHSEEGTKLLGNFLELTGIKGNWSPASFVEATVAELREQLGDDKVILALSGGVDSSVTAVLLHKAIGKNLTCIFVDHGLLRKGEFESVLRDYEHLGLNVIGVNAREKFLSALKGVTDPEEKRKIIGRGFIEVFDEEAHKLKDIKWLGQGTIYPDVIESLSITGTVIKSHHNVGGLPERMKLKLVEPLRLLFKDEVRKAGRELGIPEHLVNRQPFPGPGLGIRIIGEVTAEKVRIVQEADAIYREEIAKAGADKTLGQYFAALTNMRSVGVMGDGRTYDHAIALRAVLTSDFMTAESAPLPWEVLQKVTTRIVNEVKGVNRVLYDCTGKPPGTIEFE